LFGFVGVPYLQRSKVTREQLTQACLEQLSYFYGEQAYTAKSCIIKDWAEDEFIANKDDQIGMSQHPEFNFSGLSEQLKQLQVHFVGSEFAKHEAGYLEGAINAVNRALANLIDA
jgi:monoamine oxidase